MPLADTAFDINPLFDKLWDFYDTDHSDTLIHPCNEDGSNGCHAALYSRDLRRLW